MGHPIGVLADRQGTVSGKAHSKKHLTGEPPPALGFVPGWVVFVLLGAAFVIKTLLLAQLRDHPLAQPDAGLDTTAYVNLAREVLDGNILLGPGVYYVSPLYIYFLAAALAVLHSFTAVRAVQIVLGTASIGWIYLTARHWFGARAAFIAAVVATLTGLFSFYEVLILQASIDAFLTSAALYALTLGLLDLPPEGGSHEDDPAASAFRRKNIFRRKSLLLSGLIFGIQTLNRPNILIAAAGVALVMLLVTRRVRPAAMLVIGLVIGMSPAAVRNLVVAHQWSFVSSHGGLNFYIGNSERATGFYVAVPGITPTIAGRRRTRGASPRRRWGIRSRTPRRPTTSSAAPGSGSARTRPTRSGCSSARSISSSTPRTSRSPTAIRSTSTTRTRFCLFCRSARGC